MKPFLSTFVGKENVVGNLWEISKFKLHKSLEILIKSRLSGIKA